LQTIFYFFSEAIPAIRYKLSPKIVFFYNKKGASLVALFYLEKIQF
jgi:hypothetical protein